MLLNTNRQTNVIEIKAPPGHIVLYREEEGPSWYLAGGGWQGAYYYESGAPGESRAGAYLYPDYSTAVVGLWMDHLLLQVDLAKT